MEFTRQAFEAEKLRLKSLGHVIDESDADFFFSAANGDPNRIRTVWQSMRKSPNPKAEASQKFRESMGDNFSAACDEFEGIVR
jgi:hypothetical protein